MQRIGIRRGGTGWIEFNKSMYFLFVQRIDVIPEIASGDAAKQMAIKDEMIQKSNGN